MGGSSIKWVAQGQIIQHAQLLREDVNLIGVGGISTGDDLAEFLSISRVTRCQMASRLWQAGPSALVGALIEWAAVANEHDAG